MTMTSNKKTTFKRNRRLYFNNVKCRLAFGKYFDGRKKLVLKEIGSDETIATATINYAKDGVVHSKINREIVIKNWGVNDGIYQVLRDNEIIAKAIDKVPVGYNEAHVCELLIDPEEFENLDDE